MKHERKLASYSVDEPRKYGETRGEYRITPNSLGIAVGQTAEHFVSMDETHIGSCYCGAVTIEVTGEPAEMGYCHCRACQAYSGAPVNAFTLWKPERVKVTSGSEFLARFQASEYSVRRYCT
ncbi:MAG TPA: GFA family protein, partial [Chthoniobacterales bacterium]|nr:GFA family protein [Chthoniobacterales bacterium]